MKKKKEKIDYILTPYIGSSHLMTSFRVDLREGKERLGNLQESAAVEFLEAKDNKIKVRVWHVVYFPDGRGKHTENSYKYYFIDLNKPYDNRTQIQKIKEN